MSYLKFKLCIDSCNDCAAECENCATSCLSSSDAAMLTQCILFDRYCADMCRTAAAFMARSGEHTNGFVRKFCNLCAEICNACAMECEKHTHIEQCKKCAEACRSCAIECNNMIQMEFSKN